MILSKIKESVKEPSVLCWFFHENLRFFEDFLNNCDQWFFDFEFFFQELELAVL
jgi:hypothetical protein